jgi:hypothetical protein
MQVIQLLTAVLAVALLGCGSHGDKKPVTDGGTGGGGGTSNPPPVSYTYYVVTDVPPTVTAAEYKPTSVRGGSDGSWAVEFEWTYRGVLYHMVFDTPLPETCTSAGKSWTMTNWDVGASKKVHCVVTHPVGDGLPGVDVVWQLTPAPSGNG